MLRTSILLHCYNESKTWAVSIILKVHFKLTTHFKGFDTPLPTHLITISISESICRLCQPLLFGGG